MSRGFFVVLAFLALLFSLFCILGTLMNGSFTISNPEAADSFRNAAIVFELLTAAGLVATFVLTVAALRARKR